MRSCERRAQTRQPHHRQHPHELEASEAYAKTPVGVGSLPWNPLDATATSTRGSTARAAARAARRWAAKGQPPRASGDARTRPVLSKNCQEAALAGSGTAAPRGAAANRADRAQAQAQGSYVAGSPVLEHHGHRKKNRTNS